MNKIKETEVEARLFRYFKPTENKKPTTCLHCKQTKSPNYPWFRDLYRWALRDASNVCYDCLDERIKFYEKQEAKGKNIVDRIALGRDPKKAIKTNIDPKVVKTLVDFDEKGYTKLFKEPQKQPIILLDEYEIACSCPNRPKEGFRSRYDCDECSPLKRGVIPNANDLRKGLEQLKEVHSRIFDKSVSDELKTKVWEKIQEFEQRIIKKEQVPQNEPTKCNFCDGELYYVVKEILGREPMVGLCETHQKDNKFCSRWVSTNDRSYIFNKAENGKWQSN